MLKSMRRLAGFIKRRVSCEMAELSLRVESEMKSRVCSWCKIGVQQISSLEVEALVQNCESR